MRTVKNILRHELIGLACEVVDATNKSNVGIHGPIVNETMKTLMIDQGGYKTVPKQGSTFRLHVDKVALVNGTELVGHPEDRIKKKIKKW